MNELAAMKAPVHFLKVVGNLTIIPEFHCKDLI